MSTIGDKHLPGRHLVDAYGNGGFRFADMGHRGSLLILPSGMRAWPVAAISELTEAAIAPVLAEAGEIGLFLVGTGLELGIVSEAIRWRFRDLRINIEAMPTGAAARTYNVLFAEGRRVAAGLIAVG